MTPRASTKAPDSGFIIGIKQILLKIGSLCRELHLHHQDRSGIPIVTSILRPLAGASSSSSSASTLDPDSFDDYPEIGASACGELVEGGCLIYMLALNGDRSINTPADIPPLGD
jgi:hypothetical protein